MNLGVEEQRLLVRSDLLAQTVEQPNSESAGLYDVYHLNNIINNWS